jgi:outer membrane receptor protein involved in Fe transport
MLGGAGACLWPTLGHAAGARYRLAIPAKPYAEALIDMALQANVSLVGASTCGAGRSPGLSGTYSLQQALTQLLAGAPCSYRILDPRTVRIAPLAKAAPHEPVRAGAFVSEVVVTATKRPASLDRLAADVSVIGRDQIEVTGATDVGQTTGQLAGVLTTNLGPARDKLLVRGVSDGAFTGRTRSTVATYLDETPINYNAPDPDLRLTDVERIELVRGPQGALYGSGSISGIYRIVTAKPELGRMSGGGSVTTAQTEGGSPSYEVDGYWNAPIVRGRAALRLVAYHDLQGGYLDNVSLHASNVDSTVRDGARAALRLQVSEAWQLDLISVGQRLRTNDTHYTRAGMADDERGNRIRESHKNDFAYAGATLHGELGWASLSGSLAYVHHTYSSQYDASDALTPGGALGEFGADPASIGLYLEKARVSMGVGDVVLRSARAGPLSWLVGAYGASTLEKNPSRVDIAPPATALATVYAEGRRNRLAEAALYGEAAYDFAPGWSASLGGRLFQSRVSTLSAIDGQYPVTPRSGAANQRFAGFLPKVSVQRQIAPGELIYALYSEGYRAGGFNTSGFLVIRPTRVSFDPDRLKNLEVGVKLRLLDHRLSIRTAAYYDTWSNIQTDQYRPSGLSYTANVGDARIMGLEAEVGYDWEFGLSLQANGLISSSEMTRKNPDFNLPNPNMPPRPVVNELPGVPDASGGVLAIYQRPLGHDLTLRLTGEASYVGSSAVSFDATVTSRMGRYLRARLGAELASEHWSAQLFVANPTDDSADTFAYGNPFSFGQVRQTTPQRPRTVGLRLAATF